jgi:hypothetical protein
MSGDDKSPKKYDPSPKASISDPNMKKYVKLIISQQKA